MRPTPAEEWQRLTKVYGEMSDGELEEVASDFANLTEVAQPILRDEMKKRGLDDPSAPATKKSQPQRTAEPAENTGEDLPLEYSWKVLLCECDTTDEAYNLKAALQRNGLDAWVEEPNSTAILGIRYPKVIVAADQLEEARRNSSTANSAGRCRRRESTSARRLRRSALPEVPIGEFAAHKL